MGHYMLLSELVATYVHTSCLSYIHLCTLMTYFFVLSFAVRMYVHTKKYWQLSGIFDSQILVKRIRLCNKISFLIYS